MARVDPEAFIGHFLSGTALFALGDYEKARDEFNKAIRLEPRFALAYEARGEAWAKLGEPVVARADFDEAARLDPRFERSPFRREKTPARKSAQPKPSIDEFFRTVPLRANLAATDSVATKADVSRLTCSTWGAAEVGCCYTARAREWLRVCADSYGKAIADFNQGVDLEPENVGALCERARAWLGIKNYGDAMADSDGAV